MFILVFLPILQESFDVFYDCKKNNKVFNMYYLICVLCLKKLNYKHVVINKILRPINIQVRIFLEKVIHPPSRTDGNLLFIVLLKSVEK